MTEVITPTDTLPGGINRYDLAMKSQVVTGLASAAMAQLNEISFVTPSGKRNAKLDHIWAMVSALEPLTIELADMCDRLQLGDAPQVQEG